MLKSAWMLVVTFEHTPFITVRSARSSPGIPGRHERFVLPPRTRIHLGWPTTTHTSRPLVECSKLPRATAPILPIRPHSLPFSLSLLDAKPPSRSSTAAPKPPTAAGERRACAAAVFERQSSASVRRCARPPQNKAERVQSRRVILCPGQKGACREGRRRRCVSGGLVVFLES